MHNTEYIYIFFFFQKPKLRMANIKLNVKLDLIVGETVSYFQEQILQESWEKCIFFY